jgi:DNA primase
MICRKFGEYSDYLEWRSMENGVDVLDFELLFGMSGEEAFKAEQKVESVELPVEYTDLGIKREIIMLNPARNYLFKRGLSWEDIYYWKIGFCSKGPLKNRIIIPSFDYFGKINYYVARDISNTVMYSPYLNPGVLSSRIIFNELYIDYNKPFLLVEGVFDAMKMRNKDYNVIPVLGSHLEEESLLFQKIVQHDSDVILCFDPDAKAKQLAVAEKFLMYDISVSELDVSPYKDPGEVPKEEFQNIIKKQKYLDFMEVATRKFEMIGV